MLDDSESDLWGGGGGGKPDASFSFLCHLPLRLLSLVELVRSMNMKRWHQHCGRGEERGRKDGKRGIPAVSARSIKYVSICAFAPLSSQVS